MEACSTRLPQLTLVAVGGASISPALLKRASLVIFFGIALLSIPTFATGTAAQLALAQPADPGTEVLDAECLRTRAYRNHHNAVCEAVLAMLRLHRATGDLRDSG